MSNNEFHMELKAPNAHIEKLIGFLIIFAPFLSLIILNHPLSEVISLNNE